MGESELHSLHLQAPELDWLHLFFPACVTLCRFMLPRHACLTHAVASDAMYVALESLQTCRYMSSIGVGELMYFFDATHTSVNASPDASVPQAATSQAAQQDKPEPGGTLAAGHPPQLPANQVTSCARQHFCRHLQTSCWLDNRLNLDIMGCFTCSHDESLTPICRPAVGWRTD